MKNDFTAHGQVFDWSMCKELTTEHETACQATVLDPISTSTSTDIDLDENACRAVMVPMVGQTNNQRETNLENYFMK